MSEFKTYKLSGGYKGITDLKSKYAFHGNSQGDDSATNDIEAFKSSQGWLSVSRGFEDIDYLNEDAVAKRSAEIEQENREYVEALKKSGEYGTYLGDISLTIKVNPLFDTSLLKVLKGKGVESYKMTFINFNKQDESIQEDYKTEEPV